jgi:hypothetical protein
MASRILSKAYRRFLLASRFLLALSRRSLLGRRLLLVTVIDYF